MRLRLAILLALVGLGVFNHRALAADEAVLGTWDIVASTPDGEIPAVMTAAHADGTLKVQIEIAGVPRTVSDEKVAEGVLTLKVMYEGTQYDLEAKVDGDSMAGSWSGGGNSGSLTAKRRP